MANVWKNFHAGQVYRADSLGVMRTGASWLTLLSLGWVLAKWHRLKPKSLLDNDPLLNLLHSMVPLDRLPALISQGHVRALAVTATTGMAFRLASAIARFSAFVARRACAAIHTVNITANSVSITKPTIARTRRPPKREVAGPAVLESAGDVPPKFCGML